MRQRIALSITLLFGLASFAQAGSVLYSISVGSSTISGTSGSLDFQFNPGPLVSQAASLEIVNFASDGTLTGLPFVTGDVSGGPLPGVISFDNATQYNDYFQAFTFGTWLSFDVLLSGPAVSSPDGTSTSGSTFTFSMFSDPGGTVPTLTTDMTNGFAATVDLNLDGTTTYSSEIVPEPGTFALTGIAIVLAGALFRRRRSVVR